MKVAVIGCGYVGLSNAILLAQHNTVYLVDVVKEKVDMINHGKSPIADKEIEDYLQNRQLHLTSTLNLNEACRDADCVIIAVPTNYDVEKEYFDTTIVRDTLRRILKCTTNAFIVVKSTVPVGFTSEMCQYYKTNRILFSPEFLREGRALYDNLYPSRIIVGLNVINDESEKMAEIFVDLMKDGAEKENIPSLILQTTEAEAVKLFANTYLAIRVGFFNELDMYAESKGMDPKHIIDGVCLDPRIGGHYNNPSFGYGGYCLPKDTKQLLANFKGIPNKLICAAVETNDLRKKYIVNRILEKKPKVVGIFRLTMKSNSDNFRQSAIRNIMDQLKAMKIEVLVYEPSWEQDYFDGYAVIHDLGKFKDSSDIILANRYESGLADVSDKVYTRDVYYRD